ncbi:MAG: stalk domain-containing protein, partial [bacterium]
QVQGPATAIVSTSTTVKPTMGGDVTKGSASSTNVSTRGNVSDLSQTPSTTSRNTVTTTPDVKIATGTKGQPTIGTQSPAIITNNSTTVNPTMGGDVTKGSASSTNVSTRGNVSDLSQTPSTTSRNTVTTTPDVKIAGSTIHQQATPQVQGPATAIVSTSTTVKPSTTGNVAKPVATNTNVTTPVDIKNTTTTSAGNRNNTTSQPGINKTGNQTRITTTVTTNRNNIVVPVVNPSQQVTTIDVVANYVTTKGETLQKIAKANNVSEAELLKINPGLSQKAALSEGTSIKIKQQPATLYVDNSQIKGYPMPMLVNGSAMVPFRAVVQAKDGTVVWIADKKEVNAWLAANKAFIKMKIGDKTATVNNQKVTMKNAPMIEKSRTMVEVSYLAEAMNLEYKYEPLSNTYCFVSKK